MLAPTSLLLSCGVVVKGVPAQRQRPPRRDQPWPVRSQRGDTHTACGRGGRIQRPLTQTQLLPCRS